MAIHHPLDSVATSQADDVFYCVNEGNPILFDEHDNRVPLGANGPLPLRQQWCRFYEQILAHNTDGSQPFPDCKKGHSHHPPDCEHCAEPPEEPKDDPVDDSCDDPVNPVQPCPDNSCIANIVPPPCTLIPVGHKVKIKATCSEGGATFAWAVAGGGATIASGAATDEVEIEGTAASAARDGVTLSVTCTGGGKTCTAEIKLTVFEVQKIDVTVKATPALTAGRAAVPADHTFSSAETADVVATQAKALILMKGSLQKVALVATVAPADIPLVWDVKRSSDDDASLGAGLPTVTPDAGDSRKAILKNDEKGSFYVRVRGDCACCKAFDIPGAYKQLPLVLVEAKLSVDNSVTHTAHIVTAVGGGSFGVRTGRFNIAAPATEAIHMNATVTMLSGGPDCRRHLAVIEAGWINNESAAENIIGNYQNGHVANSIFASNRGAATGPRNRFRPGDPAPVLVAAPLLDSGRVSAGTGGETACLTSSNVKTKANLAKGQRWVVEAVDSPGDSIRLNHGGHPGNLLTSFTFGLFFSAHLSFWANTGAGAAPAMRSYAVIRNYSWTMNATWSFTHGPPVATVVTPFTVTISGQASHDPAKEAHNTSCEVLPPTGLSLLATDERI